MTVTKLYNLNRSRHVLEEGSKIIPSGVSSLMRLMSPHPVVATRGKGSRLLDVDGNEYIDYLLAFGALINGHSHPRIVEAIREQAEELLMGGTPLELEVEVAKKISRMVPNAKRVLFASTGTEATMEAIRIARAVTGKTRIVKFEGAYHGHHDYVLWNVEPTSPGLEIAPLKIPYYPGIPSVVGKTVILAPWNDINSLKKILKRYRSSVAAIITEPVMANCGVILPEGDYLRQLREVADEFEALLIFDEVLTGFRIAPGGAQEHYGVKPDLATFGKALGGGVPIAALTGDDSILDFVAPGKIGFGGTYNAHPLSLAGASANLDLLMANDGQAFKQLHKIGEKIIKGVSEIISDLGLKAVVQGLGPIFQVFFTDLEKVRNYRETIENVDKNLYTKWATELRSRGVLVHSNWGERFTVSTQHTAEDVEKTLTAAEEAFRTLRHGNPSLVFS